MTRKCTRELVCPSQNIRLNFNCRTGPIIIIIHKETFFSSLDLIKTKVMNDKHVFI